MRNVVCRNCAAAVEVPDDLAHPHCVRCGHALAVQDTHLSASAPVAYSSLAIQADAVVERPPSDAQAPFALPAQYASWEEFRSISPAIERELARLVGRALPDLCELSAVPAPVSASREMDEWRNPLATLSLPGDSSGNHVLTAIIVFLGLSLGYFGAGTLIQNNNRADIPLGATLILAGAAFVFGGVWHGMAHRATQIPTLWVFEAGVLVRHHGTLLMCRWDEIEDFEVSNETGRPIYWLTLAPGAAVIFSAGQSPCILPIMEYVEIRVSSVQLLRRLQAIWNGERERFGVVTLDRNGFQGPKFFAPWSEIRKVITDSRHLFVDWSEHRDWVPIRYRDVSFPYLVMAISHIMIDDHSRLPPVAG